MDYQNWIAKALENLDAAQLCFEHDHMTLNHKQEELVEQLAKEIETKFPEVKFVQAYPSPESANSLWLDFTKPDDEDRLIEVIEYASERTTDILLDYGYHFVVLPAVANGSSVAKA